MDLLLQGFIAGLALSFLIGPIFFMLIRIGIEFGFRAALTYCAGVWFSDLLYILGTYFSIGTILMVTEQSGFAFYTGLLGGAILISSGIGTLLTKPKEINADSMRIDQPSTFNLFIKGFVLNTFNPFTVFFWIALSGQLSVDRGLSLSAAFTFFGGLYIVLIGTDIVKSFLAKKIQQHITTTILQNIRRIVGLALIIFGIVLIIRVIW